MHWSNRLCAVSSKSGCKLSRSLQANAHENASLTKLTRKHSSESACPSSLYVLVSVFRENSRECLWPRGPVSLLLLREFFSFCINIPSPHPNLFWGGHAWLSYWSSKIFPTSSPDTLFIMFSFYLKCEIHIFCIQKQGPVPYHLFQWATGENRCFFT